MKRKAKLIQGMWLSGLLLIPIGTLAETTSYKQETGVMQQDERVTGVITDGTEPIVGASIILKGTTRGTVSDMDGRFTLDGIKSGDVIQISYIGYVTQEIRYTGQSVLRINLAEDSHALDEVVVTALGMKREAKALGYAMTEIKKRRSERQPYQPDQCPSGESCRYGGIIGRRWTVRFVAYPDTWSLHFERQQPAHLCGGRGYFGQCHQER